MYHILNLHPLIGRLVPPPQWNCGNLRIHFSTSNMHSINSFFPLWVDRIVPVLILFTCRDESPTQTFTLNNHMQTGWHLIDDNQENPMEFALSRENVDVEQGRRTVSN